MKKLVPLAAVAIIVAVPLVASAGNAYLPVVVAPSQPNMPTHTQAPYATLQPTGIPSPTATSTPSPTPTRCNTTMQVVEDPGFERTWWDWKGDVHQTTSCSAPWPFYGSYGLAFGGKNNTEERVYQESVTYWDGSNSGPVVPEWAETGAVYFSWKIESKDSSSSPHDAFYLELWERYARTPFLTGAVYNSDSRGSWYTSRGEIDNVPALRGSHLRVELLAVTDASYPTSWCIDNVQVIFACGDQVP